MPKQKGNPRKSVALAVVIVALSVAAFAAAFYYLDGMSLIDDLLGTGTIDATSSSPGSTSQSTTPTSTTPGGSRATTTAVTPSGLALPEGVPEEFALRIWQEQIDSQSNLEHLASGDVRRVVILGANPVGDQSVLDIRAEFTDGTSSPGKIGFRRFGDVWYVSWVTGIRRGETGGQADDTAEGTGLSPDDRPLPDIADVDVELLNTIMREHVKSAAVSEEYATGVVEAVRIASLVEGPGTLTLKVEMDETHEEGYGDVIMISKEIEGKRHWFIARFTKTAAQ